MGELWQLGDEAMGSPRVRRKTLRRWGLPLVGGTLLVASLASAVRRSEDGRRLSRELDRLEGAELILRDRVAGQVSRVDSLSALPRMEEAAREIGLRRAGDGELFHLSDTER
ncbi:MAG: hypothetical protein OEU54_01865 [Gemmatimonadota bacterium]|nr:hypothetical protein [Gemmatimonadota bacterium]